LIRIEGALEALIGNSRSHLNEFPSLGTLAEGLTLATKDALWAWYGISVEYL